VKNLCLKNKKGINYMDVLRYLRHPMFLTLAVFFIAPVVVMPLGGMSLAIEVMIWAIFAMGFNILLGYTGLPSFGHGLFFGSGAYLFGLIQHNVIKGVWIPLVGSMLGCVVIAAVLAIFMAKKRGIIMRCSPLRSPRCSFLWRFSGTR
jgi:branched-chain amino acid transport system permease protein